MPCTSFRITCTIIEGVGIPDMGPQPRWLWRESKWSAPLAARASASSSVLAHPSKRHAPVMAPRMGPHIRSQGRGGPACKTLRSPIPGITSPARRTSTRAAVLSWMRFKHSRFAAATPMIAPGFCAGAQKPNWWDKEYWFLRASAKTKLHLAWQPGHETREGHQEQRERGHDDDIREGPFDDLPERASVAPHPLDDEEVHADRRGD